jgi:hypothetical protein
MRVSYLPSVCRASVCSATPANSRQSSAPRFTSIPSPSVAVVGDSVTLECAADGVPVPRFSWTRLGDETPLTSSHGSATSGSRYSLIVGMYVERGASQRTLIKIVRRLLALTWIGASPMIHFRRLWLFD